MLKKILNTFFNSRNDRLLKEYSKKVKLINELETELKKLKDSDFKVKTKEFKLYLLQKKAIMVIVLLLLF